MTLDGSTRRSRTGRRELLGALGAAALGGAFADTAGAADGERFVLRQGDRCVPVTPLRGDRPVEALYDYREAETRYSAAGATHLQRADGSVIFLYDGPDGRSLVAVHGALDGDGDGGSASFHVEGLPASGEWVVQDDSYDGASNYDRWDLGTAASVDWTWAAGRTDGGAFRGLDEEFSVTVTPAFGEDAALADRYYDGRVETWELLTGDLADPDRVALRRDEPVTLATGTCDDGGGGGDEPDDDGDATRAEQFERKAERFEEKAERVRERFEEKAERFEEKAEERDGKQAEKFRRKAEEMRRKGERKARNFERKAERARRKAERARTGSGRDGSSTRGDHGAGDDDDDREDGDDDDDRDDGDDDDDEEQEDDDDGDDGEGRGRGRGDDGSRGEGGPGNGQGRGKGRGRGDDGEDRDEDEDEGDDDDD